jgi:hypothetical protein
MFSKQYYKTLKRSKKFQKQSVNWAGYGSYQYIDQLSSIVTKYDCRTMLDYGCGKGLQYSEKNNFANLIGISEYALHDPAYKPYAVLPPGTWDLVICLDVLPFIDEFYIDEVVDLMLSRCNKMCVVALQDISIINRKKPFVCIKDQAWWQEKLSHKKIQLIWNSNNKPFDYSEFL